MKISYIGLDNITQLIRQIVDLFCDLLVYCSLFILKSHINCKIRKVIQTARFEKSYKIKILKSHTNCKIILGVVYVCAGTSGVRRIEKSNFCYILYDFSKVKKFLKSHLNCKRATEIFGDFTSETGLLTVIFSPTNGDLSNCSVDFVNGFISWRGKVGKRSSLSSSIKLSSSPGSVIEISDSSESDSEL